MSESEGERGYTTLSVVRHLHEQGDKVTLHLVRHFVAQCIAVFSMKIDCVLVKDDVLERSLEEAKLRLRNTALHLRGLVPDAYWEQVITQLSTDPLDPILADFLHRLALRA
ncbi:MAG: hypothetical protein V1745_02080 [Patescibacteria group bacterium]